MESNRLYIPARSATVADHHASTLAMLATVRLTWLEVTLTRTLSVGAIFLSTPVSPASVAAGAHSHAPPASLASHTETALRTRSLVLTLLKSSVSVCTVSPAESRSFTVVDQSPAGGVK